MQQVRSPETPFLPWLAAADRKNIAIVGICKNAGKTTLLNAVLKHYPDLKWGVLSTGRDGESTDTVFKTPKPRVQLTPGTIFCADAQSLEEHGSAIRILARTPWQRGGNRLYLASAITAIATEIGGPGTASAQSDCAVQMHKLGAEKVLIDGSLDRKSVVLSGSVDSLLLVAGASFGSIGEIIAELERLMTLAAIEPEPKLSAATRNKLRDSRELMLYAEGSWKPAGFTSLIGKEKELMELLANNPGITSLYIPGAYSAAQHHRLNEQLKGIKLLFRHPECLKLPSPELEAFLQKHRPHCLIPFKISAIMINSEGIGSDSHDAEQFRIKLRQAFPKVPLQDLMEL